MSEFDDKLSAILNDQNAMGQIMALAQSLSGPKGGGEGECPSPEPDYEGGAAEETGCSFPDFSPGRDAQLLAALRPYLRQDRQRKIDKALELLQMIRVVRSLK